MAATVKLVRAGKVLLVVTLISIFRKYFGIKSWERYKSQKVLVIKSWERPDFLPTPTITVCSFSVDTGLGYRNVSGEQKKSGTVLEYLCGGLEGEGLVECLDKNAFDLATIVQFEGYIDRGIKVGRRTFKDFPLVDEHWRMNHDYTWGPCLTLQYDEHMGTQKKINIGLNPDLKHRILFHDPRYFIRSINPTIPVNDDVLDPGTRSVNMIMLVEHRNLDVPSKRCNSEKKYSLTDCIREALSKDVGCTLSWAQADFLADLPICSTIDQHKLTLFFKF